MKCLKIFAVFATFGMIFLISDVPAQAQGYSAAVGTDPGYYDYGAYGTSSGLPLRLLLLLSIRMRALRILRL